MIEPESLFVPVDDGAWLPTGATRGPWSPDALHGGPVAALLAGAAEAAGDFGNGISGVTDFESLLFINPDLTIHLHRAPVGEWVCLEAVTWMEDRGLALAESRLWDEQGPIGRSLQSLFVDHRAPGGAP